MSTKITKGMGKFAKLYVALTVVEAAAFGYFVYAASTAEVRPWDAKGKSLPTPKRK